MEQDHRDCLEEITKALTRFQFIEEGILVYLKDAYLLIEQKMRGQLSIRLSAKELEGKSLGALIKEFQRFNGNYDLIGKIKGLIKERNNLAHKGFFMMYEKLLDGKDLALHTADVRRVTKRAEECVEQLQKESERLESLSSQEGRARQ